MKPCPRCGAMLAATLADQIGDPKIEDVWCPRHPPIKVKQEAANEISPAKRLLGYAMLAAAFDGRLAS
jgi:hypothetical protein